MEELYPGESQKTDVLGHLEELRRRILICLAVFLTATGLLFLKGTALISLAKRPLGSAAADLVFIGPTEAFLSYLKVTLLASFVVCFPVLIYHAWAFLSPALSANVRRNIVLWLLAAFVLFYGGILFAYFLFIPAALSFLIGFGREIATPLITLDRYVSFFTAFSLIGGGVFEIPVLMALLAEAGILKSEYLRKNRKVAIVFIFIAAALVTPTQDIVNMFLFVIPMFLLYQTGGWVVRAIETKKKKNQKELQG